MRLQSSAKECVVKLQIVTLCRSSVHEVDGTSCGVFNKEAYILSAKEMNSWSQVDWRMPLKKRPDEPRASFLRTIRRSADLQRVAFILLGSSKKRIKIWSAPLSHKFHPGTRGFFRVISGILVDFTRSKLMLSNSFQPSAVKGRWHFHASLVAQKYRSR